MAVPLRYNLRNLVERKGTTIMTAFGIALTVAVLVVAIALTRGLERVFSASGDSSQFLVLRKGTDAELSSAISSEAYEIIRQMPGIARDSDGNPMVSPESNTVVNLPSVDVPEGMNVTVRGMLPIGLKLRPFELKEGKAFDPGRRQVIVGEAIARRYPSAKIGQKLRFGRGEWDVVGVFASGETAANSEIWCDLSQLRGDFETEGGSSSLLIRATSPEEIPKLAKVIDDDQRLAAHVIAEKAYYASLTSAGLPLMVLGYGVAIIMAVGSSFAATNTMYAAVSRRTREIGTLRALGFSRGSILTSFVFESVCLSLLGGLAGVLLAWPVNGFSTGVGSFTTFSETAFKLHIDYLSVVGGLLFSAVIGAVGGFLPAWTAARTPIVAAMRDV